MTTKNPSRATLLAAATAAALLGKLIAFVLFLLAIKAIAAFVGGVSWPAAAVLSGALVILGMLRSR